jgi:preprotein translocase subunit SecF
MWIVNHRKLFYTFSIILVVASFVALFAWGLLPGIDFTGGTLIEVAYSGTRPAQPAVTAAITAIDPGASVRPSVSSDNEAEYIVRMKDVTPAEKDAVMKALSANGSAALTVKASDSIGAVLGAEALRKAIWSVILVILVIVIYITFVFRKVSQPVASWKYGMTVIICLVHNIVIPIGLFSLLGHSAGYEVDTLFITALLVVLGFSVHDNIVVFDRVRENLRHASGKEEFSYIVGRSVSQTITRSVNTSLTTLIALVVLYILGGSTTQHFTLALIVGIAAGTYSSIFVGSPLLVTLEKWQKKK